MVIGRFKREFYQLDFAILLNLSVRFYNLIISYHMDFVIVNLINRNRRRRAKALLDFERHDDDELGFRKNDIITVRHHVSSASFI